MRSSWTTDGDALHLHLLSLFAYIHLPASSDPSIIVCDATNERSKLHVVHVYTLHCLEKEEKRHSSRE
jgi:hypothetical protein